MDAAKSPFMTGDHPLRRRGVPIDLADNLAKNQQRIPPLYVQAGEVILVPTGWQVEFPPASVLKLYIRSSVSLQGLSLANNVAIIDADYRGEVFLALKNNTANVLAINHGDRLAQAILEPCPRPVISEDTTSQTARGAGGFGSTGTSAQPTDELTLEVENEDTAAGPPPE